VREALEEQVDKSSLVTDEEGRWLRLEVRPLRSGGLERGGAVVTLADVDAPVRSASLLAEARDDAESIVATIREPLLVLDELRTVRSANGSFYRTFGLQPGKVVGARLTDQGDDWRRPELAAALDRFESGLDDGDLRPEEILVPIGSRTMAISARRLLRGGGPRLLLLAFDDQTGRLEREARIVAYQERLQDMAFEATLVEHRTRRRLAADLHDNIGQNLALAQYRLRDLLRGADPAMRQGLDGCIGLLGQVISDTRAMTFELSPPVLYDLGLPAALEWLADQLREQYQLEVSVSAGGALPRLEDEAAAILFRAVRELLLNVVKHARVGSASVRLLADGERLTAEVADLGGGFDPGSLEGGRAAKGFGLFSVRETIARLGGTLAVTSRPSRGTTIALQIPLASRRAEAGRVQESP
jgi:signal transduction histidine kinase